MLPHEKHLLKAIHDCKISKLVEDLGNLYLGEVAKCEKVKDEDFKKSIIIDRILKQASLEITELGAKQLISSCTKRCAMQEKNVLNNEFIHSSRHIIKIFADLHGDKHINFPALYFDGIDPKLLIGKTCIIKSIEFDSITVEIQDE